MTASEVKIKEWLSRGYMIDKEISMLKREKQKTLEACIKRRGAGERVQTSKMNETEDRFIDYAEYSEMLDKAIAERTRIKAEILRAVSGVNDSNLRVLLEMRYLKFYSWEQIAECMGYDVRHIYRLHKRALELMRKILEGSAK